MTIAQCVYAAMLAVVLLAFVIIVSVLCCRLINLDPDVVVVRPFVLVEDRRLLVKICLIICY